MASRTQESPYWDSHQLPHNQYHSQSQHYYSSTPVMVNQQQPRQGPTFNSASEGSSTYSTTPSSNTYYGSFYQGQMNNGINGQSQTPNNAAPNYTTMSGGNNGYPSQASSHNQNNGSGNIHPSGSSSNFVASPHGVNNMSSSHGMAPYPMNNHSSYHLNNSGIYQRSHAGNGGGGDFAGPMTHAGDDLVHQSHPQHPYHGSSQHSPSPTIDGSEYGHGMKQKRRQVKNACINCQKACKRCDEGRPCTRCVKYGLTDTCQDSARKERKRGIKRGPYKRRATTGSQPASSSSGSQYPASSSFMEMDGLSSSSFLGHHNGSHGSLINPHSRSHRDQQQHGGSMTESGQGMESSLLNSPSYPASAPGTIQRMTAPLINHESVYNREHFHSMQPPRFTSRHEYDRTGNSPAQSMYNGNRTINALPPPISAPASSTSFSSSPASGYSSRGLFSPPGLVSTNSANFLSATNGHHRLHSDSSINTMASNSTTANSLSPRTPMSMSASGSNSNMVGDLGLIQQSLSANSSTSSPPGGKGNGHGYVHHPGPTTTTSLPLTATGAFLNPSTASSNNSQPFPLHIPHSARWRSSNGLSSGDRDVQIRTRDEKDEQLAPIKLHNSNDSDLSNGNLSIRYQLPSPRMAEAPRSDSRGTLPKMDVVA